MLIAIHYGNFNATHRKSVVYSKTPINSLARFSRNEVC